MYIFLFNYVENQLLTGRISKNPSNKIYLNNDKKLAYFLQIYIHENKIKGVDYNGN